MEFLKSSRSDLVATLVLNLLGLVATVAVVMLCLNWAAVMNSQWWAIPILLTLQISSVVAAAVWSAVRLHRKRLAFWIPGMFGVFSTAAIVAVMSIAVVTLPCPSFC